MTDKIISAQEKTTAKQIARDLLDFIGRSPTPFHAVSNAEQLLQAAGYSRLTLEDDFPEQGRFYITRNDASLVVFSINAPRETGFALVGAHTDSPCLKLKPNTAYIQEGYAQLGVEVYGGALLAPWFDRDLSLAGRVTIVDEQGKMRNRLIDIREPVATIPSLAIHLNRDVNEKNEINKQQHLPPVAAVGIEHLDFQEWLLEQLEKQYPGESFAGVLTFELSLYDSQPPALIGMHREMIASARLDNLLSSYIGLRALLESDPSGNCALVLNDHEEVGSSSASGAAGPFLESALRKVCVDENRYRRAMERSFLISADNAHALHPNYSDRHEARHQPRINGGPVIKINHNQRYASNSETQAYFSWLCRQQSVPCQEFVVRSDMGCGSTIGPITATELGVRTVDVGAPQLAMHSIREQAGVMDCAWLLKVLTAFYNTGTNVGWLSEA